MEVNQYNKLMDKKNYQSSLKELGLPYTVDSIAYQVPLNEEAQIAVTSVAVQYIAGLFEATVFHWNNGVKMPINKDEFMAFAQWFGIERNRFFIEEVEDV